MNNYCLYHRYGDISSYLNELDESMTWMALNQQSLETAFECPECPHPGENLPTSWESAPEGVK